MKCVRTPKHTKPKRTTMPTTPKPTTRMRTVRKGNTRVISLDPKEPSSEKRPRKSRDLATKEEKRKKSVHNNVKRLVASFKDEIPSMQSLLDSDSDRASEKFQKNALLMLIDLIPIAEAKYREHAGEHAAYALNTLISQARELVSDIHASNDSRQLALTLTSDIVKPSILSISQNMVDNIYQLRRRIETYVKPNKSEQVNAAIDDVAKSFAVYLEEQYAQLHELIYNKLTED